MKKPACVLLYCRNSPFPALLAVNPPHILHRWFDSAFLGSVQTQDKSLKATGKNNTVEMKTIKYKVAETVWRFYDGGHFGYSYLLYRALSASTSRKKLTPPCAAEGLIWQRSLLSCSGTEVRKALWMAVEEGVHAHSQELFPKLFVQEQFKQMLNQRNRESWVCRMDKSPWVELRHDQSSRSGANYSGIMAQCLLALQIPSYRTDITYLLMDMQQTSPRNSGQQPCVV